MANMISLDREVTKTYAVSHERSREIGGGKMAFFVGIFLFVVVAGLVDRRLPWPTVRDEEVSK